MLFYQTRQLIINGHQWKMMSFTDSQDLKSEKKKQFILSFLISECAKPVTEEGEISSKTVVR